MTGKQKVGVVLAVAGVILSVGHLVVMMTGRWEPYHGLTTWVMLGLALTVIGLLLLAKKEQR